MDQEAKHSVVLVTFNPNQISVERVAKECELAQVSLFIVDNSSESIFQVKGCRLIRLDRNLGIAAAQNIGMKEALRQGAKLITLLDQDTQISSKHLIQLADAVYQSPYSIVAPTLTSRSSKTVYDIVWMDYSDGRLRSNEIHDESGRRWTNIAISSGLTFRSDLLETYGWMDERLFIDYVDTEWCLRMYQNGHSIEVVTGINLCHEIGDKSINLKLFNLPVHDPFRRYFRVRNSIYLLWFRHFPRRYVVVNFLVVSAQQILLALFHPKNFLAYASGYVRALIDGLRGISKSR